VRGVSEGCTGLPFHGRTRRRTAEINALLTAAPELPLCSLSVEREVRGRGAGSQVVQLPRVGGEIEDLDEDVGRCEVVVAQPRELGVEQIPVAAGVDEAQGAVCVRLGAVATVARVERRVEGK